MTPSKQTKQSKTQPTKTGKGIHKLGEKTEYRIARLFIWMGYFVRRGREIYTTGYLDQATDLDVLATRYRTLFSRETITIESKTGREGPLDRIFWLSGVRQYVRADRALLYRPPTKWNIRDFAKAVGVEIFDPHRLSELESRYVGEPDRWLGLCDWDFLSARVKSWNKILAANSKYRELYQTLVTEVRYEEPFALIAFWIHHLRGLTRDCARESKPVQELVRFLITDAVGQLALSFLRVAQLTSDLAETDRKGMVTKKLVYGEQEEQLVERIFQSSYQIAKAAIRDKLGTDVEIDRALFTAPTPDYVEEVVDLIEELVRDSEQSADLPQIVDLIMSECFLKGNKERRVVKRIFPGEGLAQRVAAAQKFLGRLLKLKAVPPAVEDLLAIKPDKETTEEDKRIPKQESLQM